MDPRPVLVPQPRVMPAPAPAPGTRAEGPLSLRTTIATTPWPQQVQAMKHWTYEVKLDSRQVSEEVDLVTKLLTDLFPDPATPRLRAGIDEARKTLPLILSPIPAGYMATNYEQLLTWELQLCTRPPGEMRPCWASLPPPPPVAAAPFEITEVAGATVLTVHDLSKPWPSFDAALDQLDHAKAIVVDMRTAAGTDPRPLLPWLERITGRAPFKPLREIHRPKDLDPYVAAYAARYASESRDPAVWASLVGVMPAAQPTTSPPVAVVVGENCGAACELVARSLVTYAGATLYGQVVWSSRLDRDEPALLLLPYSNVEIYFNATAYILDEDIERVTGPTSEWDLRTRDSSPATIVTFAARHLLGPPTKRCDAMTAFPSVRKLPPAVRAKIPDIGAMAGCRTEIHIAIETSAPFSAVQRFGSTCNPPVALSNDFASLGIEPQPVSVLSQLAQSDLVDRIAIGCEESDDIAPWPNAVPRR
jgi:hypothetical protein